METKQKTNRLTGLKRLTCVFIKHSMILGVIATSIGLGAIISIGNTSYDAHFLLKPKVIHHITTAIPSQPLTKREQRILERKRRATLIHSTTTVAGQKPFLAFEELRPAAPQAPVLPITSAAASSQSTAATAYHSFSRAFPAFGHTVHPVAMAPDWGAMTSPQAWNRKYKELLKADFVRIPTYDLHILTTPTKELLKDRYSIGSIQALTAKLYYSTRFFGAYNLDATEFSAVHPGIDLKLAAETPVGAIAGGRVHAVRNDDHSLGLHVIIEHRAPDGDTYYSIYGHLDTATVETGDTVLPGSIIGTVGISGHTTGPHIHLQVDKGVPDALFHEVYWPASIPSPEESEKYTVNPIVFIRQFADGE